MSILQLSTSFTEKILLIASNVKNWPSIII